MRFGKLFVLQNTIHWIKSITIDESDGSSISRGHFKPISSPRFLNDCHEYVFHLTPTGRTPIDRLALGVPYADKSNIARWGHTGGKRQTLPRQHVVRSLRDDQEPRQTAAASGDVPGSARGQLHQAPRHRARADDARSVSRHRELSRRGAENAACRSSSASRSMRLILPRLNDGLSTKPRPRSRGARPPFLSFRPKWRNRLLLAARRASPNTLRDVSAALDMTKRVAAIAG